MIDRPGNLRVFIFEKDEHLWNVQTKCLLSQRVYLDMRIFSRLLIPPVAGG